jgi:hypothetical protein
MAGRSLSSSCPTADCQEPRSYMLQRKGQLPPRPLIGVEPPAEVLQPEGKGRIRFREAHVVADDGLR